MGPSSLTIVESASAPSAGKESDELPSTTAAPRATALRGEQLVKATLLQIYDELFAHDGYASLKVEIRILRRGQKEVILDAGKQFRFVVDYAAPNRGKHPCGKHP
jgi:hypothetical protein